VVSATGCAGAPGDAGLVLVSADDLAGGRGFWLAHPEQLAGFALFAGADFPTVKYFFIFSSRLGPIPRMAIKSSTLLNAPYDLRICRIFSAVTGPIPGTNCNWAELAVFTLTGCEGGFLVANPTGTSNTARVREPARRRRNMPRILFDYDSRYNNNNSRLGPTTGAHPERRKSLGRQRGAPEIRFAPGRRQLRSAYLRNPDIGEQW